MNVAIIGFGKQGKSSAEYWFNKGNVVVICDENTNVELPSYAIDKLGIGYLDNLHEFDLIVRSPSVHPKTILDANPDHPEIKDKITSNTSEFFEVCKAPIIGVTGTKGKGTTCTLIARILESAGKKVHIGGNIGTPPLDLLKNNISESDYVVLELANFQLIDMKQSPHIAVCLMIAEEHLNWHADMYEYTQAKKQIFTHQKPNDMAVYNALDVYSTQLASSSPAQTKISYEVPEENQKPNSMAEIYVEGEYIKYSNKKVIKLDEVPLKGRHNLQNVCASIGATWQIINCDSKFVKQALRGFVGLPHRLENIGTFNGVTYIDDSFGTNPATAEVAIEAFSEPKVLILGGSNKNNSFTDLIATIKQSNIRHIIGIGETGPKIIEQINSAPETSIPSTILDSTKTMKDIVSVAQQVAQPGDIVLLSTACASFGMFKDYEDRGQQFKTEVKALYL